FDPEIFNLYGDNLALAEYYQIQKGEVQSLHRWLDETWHAQEIDVRTSRIHRQIVDLDFPIIYTTNYDRWIERAYEAGGKRISRITNVADLSKTDSSDPYIVKFHGDFDDDESLVLTESSYYERLSFESPLDIKLWADSLARPLLFIGYSLTDINLRYLLYKLDKQWQVSNLARTRPKSYIFLTSPNPVQEVILKRRGIEAIVSDEDDPGEGLSRFLEDLLAQCRT
ncbi:MAG: SIR2 family protein, partial [Armatimonadota bacterium]